MRKSRIFLILVAAFYMLSMTESLSAKKARLAYYYYDAVIEGISIDSSAEIRAFRQMGENTIAQMEEDYNNELALYEKEKNTLSDVQKELREKMLQERRELIELKKESLIKDVEILTSRLGDNTDYWLSKAVAEVSAEYKVTFVNDENHDCSSRPIGAINLTTEVRQSFLMICQCEDK